jgi:hypothetical protein
MTDKKETAFKELDPFNPNLVEGILLTSNEEDTATKIYGDLHILKVNGVDCDQYIHCTPKFYYPSNVTSMTKIPLEFTLHNVNVYNKWDGTNILAYHYRDDKGKDCVSYKTRKRPFLRDSKYAPFLALWRKVLERHKGEFEEIIINNPDLNICFELYGYLNKIVVEYKEDIEGVLLYGITKYGGVCDPINFSKKYIPLNRLSQLTNNGYSIMYKDLDAQFIKDKSVEGYMLYCDEGIFKCKSPSILSEQSKGTAFCGYNDAYTTAMNALEEIEDTNDLFGKTIELLKEVYDDFIIQQSMGNIVAATHDIVENIHISQDIKDLYAQCPFAVKTKDEFEQYKKVIMPWMVPRARCKPNQVYRAILKLFL